MKSKIDLVKAWLKKAENDLMVAENSVEAKVGLSPYCESGG